MSWRGVVLSLGTWGMVAAAVAGSIAVQHVDGGLAAMCVFVVGAWATVMVMEVCDAVRGRDATS